MAHMKTGQEYWLCDDCTIFAVNGDLSGVDSDERVKKIEEGAERLGRISPDFDSETEEGIKDFSSHRCDACGTRLAGSRHRFVTLVPLTKAEERELAELKAILKDNGYDPGFAHDLLEEGMGPLELEDRLRHKPGTVGSLEYTHEIHRGQRSKYHA